jgi:hypothetical protein
MEENEVLDDPITNLSDEEINVNVGNNSRTQERAGERNDKQYSNLKEKSDFDIYNPNMIESISVEIQGVEVEDESEFVKLGRNYPILVAINDEEVSTAYVNNISWKLQLASNKGGRENTNLVYIKDGILYVSDKINTTNYNYIAITGSMYVKDEEHGDFRLVVSDEVRLAIR